MLFILTVYKCGKSNGNSHRPTEEEIGNTTIFQKLIKQNLITWL